MDGSLTAKFELEVRPNVELDPMPLKRASIEVPAPTIAAEFTNMFEEGRGADVTFVVQGERVPAHSQILAARSSVFERQLNSGMKESISKDGRGYSMLQLLFGFPKTIDFDYKYRHTLVKHVFEL